jgi:hypothetical protein
MSTPMIDDKIIYIVHCVDTEGPLHESLNATFERVKKTFGIEMECNAKNLEALRIGHGVPPRIKDLVMEFVSEDRLNYNKDWNMIDLMLDDILSRRWRDQYIDDYGNGYIFNWFILDHVGYETNPRRRQLGYNVIFDYYYEKLRAYECVKDETHLHFHPVSFFREAHKSSNNFSFTNEHIQILSRRIIEYGWFPAAFRPGFHCERPDINLFLEQWIPFDYGNQGMEKNKDTTTELQKDIAAGRYGDWRRATPEWEVYHPDFYDYQIKGNMKRYIARCLNLNARLRAIDEYQIEKAFRRAHENKRTIMAITNHDEREMRPYIDEFYRVVQKIKKRYPSVKIMNSGAVQAMRGALKLKKERPVRFDVMVENNMMTVKTDKRCWGPQPFFCFKTKTGEYIHENLDYHGGTRWSYVFDDDTINLECLEAIGLATNDEYGNTSIWRTSL